MHALEDRCIELEGERSLLLRLADAVCSPLMLSLLQAISSGDATKLVAALGGLHTGDSKHSDKDDMQNGRHRRRPSRDVSIAGAISCTRLSANVALRCAALLERLAVHDKNLWCMALTCTLSELGRRALSVSCI